jgi:hypothetical protein
MASLISFIPKNKMPNPRMTSPMLFAFSVLGSLIKQLHIAKIGIFAKNLRP